MDHIFSNYQISYSCYELKKKSRSNAVTHDAYQAGALIRIQDDNGDVGYADLCPWPSLGDLSLNEELRLKGPLFRHALDLAEIDLKARRDQVLLVSNEPIKNNILIADYKNFFSSINNHEKDFSQTLVKIKGDLDIHSLVDFLKINFSKFKKIRIDFNFCLTENLFADFLNLIDSKIKSKIQYIEDPFPFDKALWKKYSSQVKLALDWKKPGEEWTYLIQKPSREPIDEMISSTLTSAMEHPVGFVHGLHHAQKYLSNIHGFSTLESFEATRYHQYFKIFNDEVIYNSDGYGIGFTQALKSENWIPYFNLNEKFNPFLLYNSRSTEKEIKTLFKLKKKFLLSLDNISDADSKFLIPSSGSQKSADESLKVLVLSNEALKNSALRVNSYFKIDSASIWGNVLPLNHVGGLGCLFRAELANSKIYFTSWDNFSLEWLNNKKMTHLSLVPTQIFEIVQKNWQAPECLKLVFVGGGALDKDLSQKAIALGWPIVETYGMTETASMIAVRDFRSIDQLDHMSEFKLLPGIEIKTYFDKVDSSIKKTKITCNSLAEMSLRLDLINENLLSEQIGQELIIDDLIEQTSKGIKFLGRNSDFIKIKGEGVSLRYVREILRNILLKNQYSEAAVVILDLPDQRNENELNWVIHQKLISDPFLFSKIKDEYNNLVKPYERPTQEHWVLDMPVSDLGKVLYAKLKEMIKS